MISTVSLSFDLSYVDPITQTVVPKGIVTDSTDYIGLGLSPLLGKLKGLGVISFNGDIIVNENTVGNPMIDLEIWDFANNGVPTYSFDLPLDVNGNVANGIYTFTYSLRVLADPFLGVSLGGVVTAPNVLTVASNEWVYQFLESGNGITLIDGATTATSLVSSTSYNDPDSIVILATPPAPANYVITFELTNVQLSGVYSYSGCTQTTASVNFVYDCEYDNSGTWGVSNTTQLSSNEVVSDLSCTINYPSWTGLNPNFNPQVFTTSLPYPTLPESTPLATGTYGVSLTQQIQQTQTDGLIILYTTSVVKEFVVTCSGSLCGLLPCIENLRAAHQAELVRNRVSKYQVYVDNVLLYGTQAINYRSCGEIDKYNEMLANIQANLDSSGCECACCDDETYYWVSNNSASSVIDSLLQSFQFRLFNLTPPGPGSPTQYDDESKGVEVGALWENVNTKLLYVCTNNSLNNAVWQQYYDPNAPFPGFNAQSISYAGAPLYPGPTNVKVALDVASTNIISQGADITTLQGDVVTLTSAVAGKVDIPVPPVVGGTATKVTYNNNGLIISGTTLSASDIPAGVDAAKISTGLVSNTEFGYLNNVTSNIQTQLNGKLPLNLTANTTLDQNNYVLTFLTGTAQTDIAKSQGATSSASALTVQARNAAAGNGFGSSVLLSGNITGNSTQISLSRLSSYWTDAAVGSSEFSLSTTKSSVESVKLTVNSDGQLKLTEYNATNFVDPSPAYMLGVDTLGNVVKSNNPLVYVALLTQTGTSNPVVTVIKNTTGQTLTWDRVGAGYYRCLTTGTPFTTNKTIITISYGAGSTDFVAGINSYINTTSSAYVLTTGMGPLGAGPAAYADDLLVAASVKIEIYS